MFCGSSGVMRKVSGSGLDQQLVGLGLRRFFGS
jgi:hypothetical protein